jgi:hypothetical protein
MTVTSPADAPHLCSALRRFGKAFDHREIPENPQTASSNVAFSHSSPPWKESMYA